MKHIFDLFRRTVTRMKTADIVRVGLLMVGLGILAIVVFYATGIYNSTNNMFVFIPPVLTIAGTITFVIGVKKGGDY